MITRLIDLLRSIGAALLSGLIQLATIVLVCMQYACRVASIACGAAFLVFAIAGFGLAARSGLIPTRTRL